MWRIIGTENTDITFSYFQSPRKYSMNMGKFAVSTQLLWGKGNLGNIWNWKMTPDSAWNASLKTISLLSSTCWYFFRFFWGEAAWTWFPHLCACPAEVAKAVWCFSDIVPIWKWEVFLCSAFRMSFSIAHSVPATCCAAPGAIQASVSHYLAAYWRWTRFLCTVIYAHWFIPNVHKICPV